MFQSNHKIVKASSNCYNIYRWGLASRKFLYAVRKSSDMNLFRACLMIKSWEHIEAVVYKTTQSEERTNIKQLNETNLSMVFVSLSPCKYFSDLSSVKIFISNDDSNYDTNIVIMIYQHFVIRKSISFVKTLFETFLIPEFSQCDIFGLNWLLKPDRYSQSFGFGPTFKSAWTGISNAKIKNEFLTIQWRKLKITLKEYIH